MFSPADSLDDFPQKRSGIRECRMESARELEGVGARAYRLHTFHDSQRKRTAVRDCCRLEAARDLKNAGSCEAGLHALRKLTVIRNCRVETVCDLENVVPSSSINPLDSDCSPVSGPGEISSGKSTPSSSEVAGAPSSPDVSITRSSPMLEEHHAENISQLPHEESCADTDDDTSLLYATGRLRDLKTDGGSPLAESTSACSMVSSTPVAVVNKGTGEDRNYFCKDEEDFQLSSFVWTDDKHSSYLRSMEDQFLRDMFEMEFGAIDVCGQSPEHTDYSEVDSAASQLRSLHDGAISGGGKTKAWRDGSWRPVALKSRFIGGDGASAVVFKNPWIKRFRTSTNVRINPGTDRSQSQNGCSSSILGDHNLLHFPTGMVGEQTHELVSDVQKGVHRWQEKLQNHGHTVHNRSSRIEPRDMKAFRRDDRLLAEGASKRLKVEQLREHQGDGISTVSQNRGWTADACKLLNFVQQQEHQGAFTDSRDRARKFDGLPSASLTPYAPSLGRHTPFPPATSKFPHTFTLPEGSSMENGVLFSFERRQG